MSKKSLKLIFALSLLAGGWSHVFAAALCPHQGCSMSGVAGGDMRAAASDANTAEEHCSAGMEHSGHQSHAAAAVATGSIETQARESVDLQVVIQRPEACAHCVCGGQTAPVASAFVGASNQLRRDAEVSAAPRDVKTCMLPEVASFSSRAPFWKSPPVSVQQKFLLTHSFLI